MSNLLALAIKFQALYLKKKPSHRDTIQYKMDHCDDDKYWENEKNYVTWDEFSRDKENEVVVCIFSLPLCKKLYNEKKLFFGVKNSILTYPDALKLSQQKRVYKRKATFYKNDTPNKKFADFIFEKPE